jgi:hypothetical protein
MLLSMRRRDLEMRYFGSDSTAVPLTTLILPSRSQTVSGQGEGKVRLTRPVIRDLSSGLESRLDRWDASSQEMGTFVLYELKTMPEVQPAFAADVRFEDQIQLLEAELPVDLAKCGVETCRFLSIWRVLALPTSERRFFLHVVDSNGDLVAQHDGLDAPAQYWQAGDLIVQEHLLPNLPQGELALRIGVYDPQNGRRLLLRDGSDYFTLTEP